VAFAGPVSGPSAEDGLSAVRAIELVFDQVNAEGGIGGRPLVLDVYDDANDPERARENALRIADQGDTVAVVGHNFSTCSIAAGSVYAERGLPAIATAATSLAVTKDNPWYFRTIYNDRAQGRFVTLYVRELLGATRFGVVHETQAYGAYLARVMSETAPELGLSAPMLWSLDPASPDLEARAARIAREATAPGAPPVLVLAMQPAGGVPVVKALRDAGFEGELMVTDALASQAFVDGFLAYPEARGRRGFYTDGIYASTPFLFDAGGRVAAEFARLYAARHVRPPDWYAAFAADAARVLVEGLQRIGADPKPEHIESDRQALRDVIAGIRAHDAVEGVTGATWFDAEGDAEKPVPMGRFLAGDTVSAFLQLRPVPLIDDPADADPRLDPARLVPFGGRVLYRTQVARVGIRANRFSNIDFEAGTFDMDFNLWFRHGGDDSVEDLVLTNAVGPVDLGRPIDTVEEDGRRYRLYRTTATLRTDLVPAGYGRHSLGLSVRHRSRTRDDLVLAIDAVGMNLGQRSSRATRGAPARRLLSAGTGWALEDVLFFEDEVDEPGLGHPSYVAAAAGRPFSQLTIAATLRRATASIRELLPASLQRPVLAVGLVGTLALTGFGGGAPRVRFALQVVAGFALLLAAEPVLGDWLRMRVGSARLAQATRVFDILWWIVPALFVNLAVDRFVWKPAEKSSGRPVPTLLRWFVASVIFLFAFFGVVAFVYHYTLTGLLATSGVVAMIIGLAVQLNITNLFAGVALNLERPFRVGDWIMIHGRTPRPEDGVVGQVVDINWRTTRLQTADETVIVIPNGQLSEKTITNFMGPHEISRFELTFTVDQSVSSDRVLDVIRAALDEVTGTETGPTDQEPPKVRIKRVTETGVEYLVHYFLIPRLVSPNKGRHTVNETILRHLREAGIELAYPKRRVYEERVPGPAGD
jgi:branched-chain amino acid transport system substrate-binding protein